MRYPYKALRCFLFEGETFQVLKTENTNSPLLSVVVARVMFGATGDPKSKRIKPADGPALGLGRSIWLTLKETALADQLFGVNWTMDKGMSTFAAGWNPNTETRKYEVIPSSYKLVVSGAESGKPYSWNYTALYDGKDHPIHGRADVDAIEAYQVNDRVTIGFFKLKGVLTGGYARMVSADGKTLIVQASGRRPDGSAYYDVIQYGKP